MSFLSVLKSARTHPASRKLEFINDKSELKDTKSAFHEAALPTQTEGSTLIITHTVSMALGRLSFDCRT